MSEYHLFIDQIGGPDVIRREPIILPRPLPGEAIVRHSAIGVNFIDTYYRAGLYPIDLPSGLGNEAAGLVEAVGDGVTEVAPGDRVAYVGGPLGAYATARTMPAAELFRLPEDIDDRTAAAVMLKGLTADMLVGPCAGVEPGQAVLVHSAAGGVGSLLVQWLKAMGATVLAHAGSADKASRAAALGADHALSCSFADLPAQVRTLTGERGVDVVFDGVGRASWEASIGSLAKRGLLVSYGNASGPVPPIAPLVLSRGGSLFLTRPTLFDYLLSPEERDVATARLYEMLRTRRLRVDIGQHYPLEQAAEAHRSLEARKTTGSTILIP